MYNVGQTQKWQMIVHEPNSEHDAYIYFVRKANALIL